MRKSCSCNLEKKKIKGLIFKEEVKKQKSTLLLFLHSCKKNVENPFFFECSF